MTKICQFCEKNVNEIVSVYSDCESRIAHEEMCLKCKAEHESRWAESDKKIDEKKAGYYAEQFKHIMCSLYMNFNMDEDYYYGLDLTNSKAKRIRLEAIKDFVSDVRSAIRDAYEAGLKEGKKILDEAYSKGFDEGFAAGAENEAASWGFGMATSGGEPYQVIRKKK